MLLEHIISLLPTFACAFWTVVLIADRLQYGERGKHSLLLWWVGVTTVLYACHAVYFTRSMPAIIVADTIYVYCNLAAYPLYARYLLQLTTGHTSRRVDALIIVPPIVMAGIVAVLYAMMDQSTRHQFVDIYLYNNTSAELTGIAQAQAVVHTVCKCIFAVGVVITLAVALQYVGRYNHMVDSWFADNDDKHLWGLQRMLLCVVVISILSVIVNAVGKSFFAHSYALLALPSVLFTAILFSLAYIGYRNIYSYNELKLMLPTEEEHIFTAQGDADPSTDPQEPTHTTTTMSTLAEQIESLMREEKLYLTHDLKVNTLATRLGTNVRYVQRAINEDLGMPFAEYVNRLRIAHAEQLLRENPGMKISDVSYNSGFTSVSTYYRNKKRFQL